MKKLIIMYVVLLLLISCQENVNSPIPVESRALLFPVHKSCYWEYNNAQEERMDWRITAVSEQVWARSFYDTVAKQIFETSEVLSKKYSNSFPVSEYFGLAYKDSTLLVGVKQHALVDKYQKYPADYYFTILSLNYHLLHDTIIVRDSLIVKYNKSYRCCDSIVIYDSKISAIDSVASSWKIKYFAKRMGYNNATYLIEFDLLEYTGFTRIDNYSLVSSEIPELGDKINE